MRNVFVLNGLISILLASVLIEREYSNDENLVVIEHTRSRLKVRATHTRPPGPNYEHVSRLFSKLLATDHLIECTYSTGFPVFAKTPLKYLREAREIALVGRSVARELDGRFDRLIYPANARIQGFLSRYSRRRIMIEHGIGEYMRCVSPVSPNAASRLKRLAVRWLTGIDERPPSEIMLMDGGKCRSISANRIGQIEVRRLAPPGLASKFEQIIKILAQEEPELVGQLEVLRQRSERYDQVFLYLPADDIDLNNYSEFLDYQLTILKPANALFVLKCHPSNPADYTRFFEHRKLDAVMVAHPLALHLPAEFYLHLLPAACPVGYGSSALFYANWWFGRTVYYIGDQRFEKYARTTQQDFDLYRTVEHSLKSDIEYFNCASRETYLTGAMAS